MRLFCLVLHFSRSLPLCHVSLTLILLSHAIHHLPLSPSSFWSLEAGADAFLKGGFKPPGLLWIYLARPLALDTPLLGNHKASKSSSPSLFFFLTL